VSELYKKDEKASDMGILKLYLMLFVQFRVIFLKEKGIYFGG